MTDQKKVQEQGSQKISRRNVLKAAMAAGGAAALGFPNIVKAQGVTTMRWQSTWPSKDIFLLDENVTPRPRRCGACESGRHGSSRQIVLLLASWT